MIVFCEDCGDRNQVCPAHIVKGRAVFICQACGYHNDYLLPLLQQKKLQENTVDHLFQVLDRDPQMMGGFIYDISKGITASQMPDLLLPEDIHSLGSRLAQSLDQGLLAMPDIRFMTVLISDKYFFVARKGKGEYLVLIALTPNLPGSFHRFLCSGRTKKSSGYEGLPFEYQQDKRCECLFYCGWERECALPEFFFKNGGRRGKKYTQSHCCLWQHVFIHQPKAI